jgi:hypothetical protein
LLGAEIRPIEDFLQADDLRAGIRSLAHEADVFLDHGLLLFRERRGSRQYG